MSFYGYQRGYSGFGIGVDDLAFQQPTTLPVDSIYAARYNVRGNIAVTDVGFVKLHQQFVPVSLLANGVYFSGDMALQALVEFEKGTRK